MGVGSCPQKKKKKSELPQSYWFVFESIILIRLPRGPLLPIFLWAPIARVPGLCHGPYQVVLSVSFPRSPFRAGAQTLKQVSSGLIQSNLSTSTGEPGVPGSHSCNSREEDFPTWSMLDRELSKVLGWHKQESFHLAHQKVMCYLLPKKRCYQSGLDAGSVQVHSIVSWAICERGL